MLRYDRQTKPGLVALYDIRPGNGAGPFLQPPERARGEQNGESETIALGVVQCRVLTRTRLMTSVDDNEDDDDDSAVMTLRNADYRPARIRRTRLDDVYAGCQ